MRVVLTTSVLLTLCKPRDLQAVLVIPGCVSRLPLSAALPHALWSLGAALLSWLQLVDALSGAELFSVSAPPAWCRKACSEDLAGTFAAPATRVGSPTSIQEWEAENLIDSLHERNLKTTIPIERNLMYLKLSRDVPATVPYGFCVTCPAAWPLSRSALQ